MKYSDERDKIFAAYVKAWGEIQAIQEGSEVTVVNKKYPDKSYSYTFSGLTDIYDVIKDILSGHGIGVMHDTATKFVDGIEKNMLNTILVHESGQYMESDYLAYEIIRTSKKFYDAPDVFFVPDMKENGGQFTYMRRFSLVNTMGLTSTDKKDKPDAPSGATVGDMLKKASEDSQPEKITPKQIGMIEALFGSIAKAKGIAKEDVWKLVQDRVQSVRGASYTELSKGSASKIIGYLEKMYSESANDKFLNQ